MDIKSLNERFDQKTKEMRIAAVVSPFIVYFIYFFLLDTIYGILCLMIRNGYFDIVYLTHSSWLSALAVGALIFAFPKKGQRVAFGLVSLFWLVYGFTQLVVLSSNGKMVRFINVFTGKDAIHFAGSVFAALPVFVYASFAVMLIAAAVIEMVLYRKAYFPGKDSYGKPLRCISIAAAAVCAGCFVLISPFRTIDKLSNHYYAIHNFIDNNYVYFDSDLYYYAYYDIESMVLAKKRAEEDLYKVTQFFDERPEHTDNDMTEVFKGKNLLVIQLESFNTDLITSGHCKELKKIYDKSMVFENYYGAAFGTEPTIGNEMAVNTGFYATTDLSASMGIDSIVFPDSLARLFKAQGVSTAVFHKNGPGFYNRDKTEKAFGYDHFYPLYELTDEKHLFEDDYFLADDDNVYSAFVPDGSFMHYFVGYSAHPAYSPDTVKDMDINNRYIMLRERHPDYTFDQNDPMEVYKAYALLTDDMAGRLIERMEQDGSIKDTVLLFVADHACIETLENASDNELLEVQNIPFFIYTDGITPQKVQKTCSNVDILPTVANMFGLENDNRFIGNDIFSDSEGLAYVPSFDWVTDRCSYVGGSVKEVFVEGDEIEDDYIERMNALVRQRIEVNNLVLYTNYFKEH